MSKKPHSPPNSLSLLPTHILEELPLIHDIQLTYDTHPFPKMQTRSETKRLEFKNAVERTMKRIKSPKYYNHCTICTHEFFVGAMTHCSDCKIKLYPRIDNSYYCQGCEDRMENGKCVYHNRPESDDGSGWADCKDRNPNSRADKRLVKVMADMRTIHDMLEA